MNDRENKQPKTKTHYHRRRRSAREKKMIRPSAGHGAYRIDMHVINCIV